MNSVIKTDTLNVTRLRTEDLRALFLFLEVAYHGRPVKLSQERWRWQYKDNPKRQGSAFDTWIVKDGDAIIAQRPTMPMSLKVGDDYYDAHWAHDFVVHPDYRGRGVGLRLMESVLNDVDVLPTLDVSHGARSIYARLGCTSLGFVPRFVRVCNPTSYLKARLGVLGELIAPALVPMWNLASRRWMSSSKHVQVEIVPRFGEWVDELWERVSACYAVIAKRDSAYLNWRYVNCPDASYILVARRGETCTGYLVYRIVNEGKRGFICDLLAAPDDVKTLDALIAHSVQRLQNHGVEAVNTYALHSAVQKRLRANGFVKRGPGVNFIVGTRLTGHPRRLLTDPDNWFVSGVDSDLDPVFH